MMPQSQPGSLRPGIIVSYVERGGMRPVEGLRAGAKLQLVRMEGEKFIARDFSSPAQAYRLHPDRLDPGLDFLIEGEWRHESDRATLFLLDGYLEQLLTEGCQDVMQLRPRAEAVWLLVDVLKRHGRQPVHYSDKDLYGGPSTPHRVPY